MTIFHKYKQIYDTKNKIREWREGIRPKLIQDDAMMKNKIDYIHNNTVKREYVDEAYPCYCISARDYEGATWLLTVERFW